MVILTKHGCAGCVDDYIILRLICAGGGGGGERSFSPLHLLEPWMSLE